MVVSDHSPCTPDLKLLNAPNGGDFMKAWGGIASVQFGKKKNKIQLNNLLIT